MQSSKVITIPQEVASEKQLLLNSQTSKTDLDEIKNCLNILQGAPRHLANRKVCTWTTTTVLSSGLLALEATVLYAFNVPGGFADINKSLENDADWFYHPQPLPGGGEMNCGVASPPNIDCSLPSSAYNYPICGDVQAHFCGLLEGYGVDSWMNGFFSNFFGVAGLAQLTGTGVSIYQLARSLYHYSEIKQNQNVNLGFCLSSTEWERIEKLNTILKLETPLSKNTILSNAIQITSEQLQKRTDQASYGYASRFSKFAGPQSNATLQVEQEQNNNLYPSFVSREHLQKGFGV